MLAQLAIINRCCLFDSWRSHRLPFRICWENTKFRSCTL